MVNGPRLRRSTAAKKGPWGNAPPTITIYHLPLTIYQSACKASQRHCRPTAPPLPRPCKPSSTTPNNPKGRGVGLTNYHLRREAAALAARLPELLPEDPALASEIQTLLDETFTEEASTPVANSAPRDYKRDKDGRFSETQGAPAPQKSEAPSATAPKKGEALPALPDPKASPTEYRKANRTRGEAALSSVLADHADVPAAMRSKKLGPIDFRWGEPGDPKQDYEGGFGFSHIIAKHGEEAAKRVPNILAYGKYYHDENENGNYLVVHQGAIVSLKRRAKNFYVVSSYEAEKKAAAYTRRGGQIENKATDDGATF